MGVAMLTGVQCRQKCLFCCIWLIQSLLIAQGPGSSRGHAVLVSYHISDVQCDRLFRFVKMTVHAKEPSLLLLLKLFLPYLFNVDCFVEVWCRDSYFISSSSNYSLHGLGFYCRVGFFFCVFGWGGGGVTDVKGLNRTALNSLIISTYLHRVKFDCKFTGFCLMQVDHVYFVF